MIINYFFFCQKWEYMHEPKLGSAEAKLTEVLKNPRDWVDLNYANRVPPPA